MEIKVLDSSKELAMYASKNILKIIQDKPDATLILTSGDTPKLCYKCLSEIASSEDFERVTIIGLDEWVGIPGTSEGSCRYIVEENLLKPLNVNPSNYTFFDSMSNDLESECKRIDDLLASKGGADLMFVGVGLNGHIGLNEPGSSFNAKCSVTNLAEETIVTGQKYFNSSTPLSLGITVGLAHLLDSKLAVLIASGPNKADILSKIQQSEPNEDLPASIFKIHTNGQFWIDKELASLLN